MLELNNYIYNLQKINLNSLNLFYLGYHFYA